MCEEIRFVYIIFLNLPFVSVFQAEMERALLQGELTAQLEKILQDEKWIEQLVQKDQKLAAELDEFRFEEGAKIQTSKSKMEAIELELNQYFVNFHDITC